MVLSLNSTLTAKIKDLNPVFRDFELIHLHDERAIERGFPWTTPCDYRVDFMTITS